MKRFALVGNPNCGKTTLFNSLTGSSAHVGNWPGVTVDKKEGIYKSDKEEAMIIDLPGIYSLSPYTPEEVITRNFIIDEKPDCIINIVDVTNLERNLYLTTQLMEMDVPIVVALNMVDVLESKGDLIDENSLQQCLGLPIVKISALKEKNIKNLIKKAISACKTERKGESVLSFSVLNHLIKDLTLTFNGLHVFSPIFHAVKLIENDELEVKAHSNLLPLVEQFKKENISSTLTNDFEALVADCRYKYIESHYAIHLKRKKEDIYSLSKSDKIDKVLTSRFFGIPIFLFILFLIFHLTFSTNFLFLGDILKANHVEDNFSFLSGTIWEGFVGLFYSSNGINSPGVILSNLVEGLMNALSSLVKTGLRQAPSWVSSLISDGLLGGVFSVISFLPRILVLFFLFSILEDTGYMARIAFILDQIFKRFGLSGRAFLPMMMGFGCSVPAMINTRTIANEKERIATLNVIPFFSCGAKLPILTGIGGCLIASFGFHSTDLLTFGIYILGVTVAILSTLLMRKTVLKGDGAPFVMELPSYHIPQLKSTLLLVWDKAKHFIKKAFTVILASTIVVWFISHFSTQANGYWGYIDTNLNESILANLGKIFQPLFTPLGFGIGKYGWVFVVSIVSGLIAKENATATLSTLASSVLVGEGIILSTSENIISTFINNLITPSSPLYNETFATYGSFILIAFIVFNTLTIPCIATVATARSELGKGKIKYSIIFWILVSYLVSSAIYLISRYIWPVSIYVSLVIGLILATHLLNKRNVKHREKHG